MDFIETSGLQEKMVKEVNFNPHIFMIMGFARQVLVKRKLPKEKISGFKFGHFQGDISFQWNVVCRSKFVKMIDFG